MADEARGAGWNWSGTHRYEAGAVLRPRTVTELQSLVGHDGPLHALGTRHSFNDIADAAELISVADLDGDLAIDEAARTVSVPAGMRYGELAIVLQRAGWALAQMASLPHISVAGSVATATHGSGNSNESLASAVRGLTLVAGTGDVVRIERDSPDFAGAVVSLGALGVVTEVTLAIEPTFLVRQDVYERLPWDALTGDFETVMGAGHSVSVMTDTISDTADLLWVKTRLTDGQPATMPAELFGATAATRDLHVTKGNDPRHCTPQLGRPGPWCDRLPHFLLEYTPSSGAEIQSEYLMDRRHAADAIAAVRELGQEIAPLLRSAEIRTIAADEFWLSPFQQRDSVGIHFTWRPEGPAVAAVVERIESALEPFEPRPHWSKVFVSDFDLGRCYPKLADFRNLAARYDPRGVFRNSFLARTVLG